jgi:sugar/nucleoside kinase (ribokinase family)
MAGINIYPTCVGDLLLERFVELPSLPISNTTQIIDKQQQAVGGSAFNLCWHFTHLGKTAQIVAPSGKNDEIIINSSFRLSNISTSSLVWVEGETSNLLCLYVGSESYNFYFRQEFPAGISEQLYSRCWNLPQLILCGSRHEIIRDTFLHIARTFKGDLLIFNPSYSVYEYSTEVLRELISRSHVTILNEYEAAFVNDKLSIKSLNQVIHNQSLYLIVTYAEKGAKLYWGDQQILVSSIAKNKARKDVVGAGDAFLAGFVHALSQQTSPSQALYVGAALAAIVVDTNEIRPEFDANQLEEFMSRTPNVTDSQ